MWPFDNFSAPGAAEGTLAVPMWALAISVALFVALLIVATLRARSLGVLALALLAVMGTWGAWAWSDHRRAEERRGLEARIAALESRAAMPGSALACLEGPLGEALEAPCERSVFADAPTTAAALAATAGRIALLRDAVAFAARAPGFDPALASLRRPLEQDGFGLAAHVLATREDCTPQGCEAFRLFHDDARLRANLTERRFETVLARYAPGWGAKTTPAPEVVGSTGGGTRAPLPPSYILPSAASIPPVSIMSPEPPPAGGTGGGGASAAASEAAPSPAPKPPAARPPRPATPPKPPQARAQTSPGAPAGQSRPPSAPSPSPADPQ